MTDLETGELDRALYDLAPAPGEIGTAEHTHGLEVLMRSHVHSGRWSAVRTAVKLGHSESRSLVECALGDPHPHIRNAAVKALPFFLPAGIDVDAQLIANEAAPATGDVLDLPEYFEYLKEQLDVRDHASVLATGLKLLALARNKRFLADFLIKTLSKPARFQEGNGYAGPVIILGAGEGYMVRAIGGLRPIRRPGRRAIWACTRTTERRR